MIGPDDRQYRGDRPDPVRNGTAETLARVAHFRALTATLPEAHELDPVLRFLLGRVTDPVEVLEHLGDELDQLWSLITEDFADSQLDELTEDDWARGFFCTPADEELARWIKTRDRLAHDVESYIRMAREWHAQQAAEAARTGAAA